MLTSGPTSGVPKGWQHGTLNNVPTKAAIQLLLWQDHSTPRRSGREKIGREGKEGKGKEKKRRRGGNVRRERNARGKGREEGRENSLFS